MVDPELLKSDRISQGDYVSIEIDLNDRISNVIKLSEVPTASRVETEER